MALEIPPVDLVRVVAALAVFGYASVLDVRERRVPHKVWLPLVAVALLAFAADLVMGNAQDKLTLAAISLAFGVLFGYGFYYMGTFGGADRYALVVLALVFPSYPMFVLPTVGTIPAVVSRTPIFVLAILGNAVILGVFYPLRIFVRNIVEGNVTNPVLMLLARKVPVDELHDHFGRIIEHPDRGVSLSRSGVLSYGGGVTDIDFVRDYVEWRGVESLKDVSDPRLEEFVEESEWTTTDVEGDEAELRKLSDRDEIWISPGIPFIVPITAGLLLALTLGDLLFLLLRVFFNV